MNCPKCGRLVDPGATFCGNCGQPLQSSNPAPTTPPVTAIPGSSYGTGVVSAPMPQPANVTSPMNMNPSLAGASGGPVISGGNIVPGYSGVTAANHPGETMAIAALIIAVIGIPGAIIPLVGFILGITGIVLGTISRQKAKRALSTASIVVAILAILLSLAVFVYNVHHLKPKPVGSSSSTGSSSVATQALSTPCFTTAIDVGLQNTTPTGCSFDAASTSEEFTVNAITNPDITSSTFPNYAKEGLASGVKSVGGTITSTTDATFSGSQAIVSYANLPQGSLGIFGLVLHPTSHGENVFYLAHVVRGQSSVSFGPLENSWQWK